MVSDTLFLDLAMFRESGAAGGSWTLPSDPRFWATVIAIMAALAALFALINLLRRDRAAGRPMERRLARAIGLHRRDVRLLRSLSRRGEFPSAACLMISRGCFDHAAGCAAIKPDDATVADLRNRLFADAPEWIHCGDERDRN